MLAEGVAKKVNIGIGFSTFIISVTVLVFWYPLKIKPGLGTIMNIIIIKLTIYIYGNCSFLMKFSTFYSLIEILIDVVGLE